MQRLSEKRQLMGEAIHFSVQQTLRSMFKDWKKIKKEALFHRMQDEKAKMDIALIFSVKVVARRCLIRWHQCVEDEKAARWIEYRKEMMRRTVKVGIFLR